MAYTLYIGNKNYSSWSLRAWLVMKYANIPFTEKRLPLDTPEFHTQIETINPAGKVPCLYDGELAVWDSLAICEYVAQRHPGLWPTDAYALARARSLAAEMHSGFLTLRTEMPMNVRARVAKRNQSVALCKEIERIREIWQDTRNQFGADGNFLFGAFSIADAFFAPVAFRFQTYAIELDGVAGTYCHTLLGLPEMQEWQASAEREAEKIASTDLITASIKDLSK